MSFCLQLLCCVATQKVKRNGVKLSQQDRQGCHVNTENWSDAFYNYFA